MFVASFWLSVERKTGELFLIEAVDGRPVIQLIDQLKHRPRWLVETLASLAEMESVDYDSLPRSQWRKIGLTLELINKNCRTNFFLYRSRIGLGRYIGEKVILAGG